MLAASALGLLTQLLGSPIVDLQEDLRSHPWRYAVASAPAVPATSSAPATAEITAKASKPAIAVPGPRWSIQLASLSNEEAALQRKQELEAVLGSGSVSILPSTGAWKLRHGAFADRKEALKVREEIKKQGLDGFVVDP